MKFDFKKAEWIFEPEYYKITGDGLQITPGSGSDFWQRTFYGFRNDNSPALLLESCVNFTFTVRAGFEYKTMFDQCGILIYINSDNWMKTGLEYENEEYSRLGSVVTNNGYSDWASTDIANRTEMYYRLHRRGPDFMIENSFDGKQYGQLRIFHMHTLGDTTEDMGRQKFMRGQAEAVRFGLYASSPGESNFTATFSEIELIKSQWKCN